MGIESPISVDEMRTHLAITNEDHDEYIAALLLAATQWAEDYQRRIYVTRSGLTQYLDRFPANNCILIERAPLISITSITYIDSGGTEQTLSSANYRVDTKSQPARVTPAWGEVWPTIRQVTAAITITYSAGYGDAAAVPDNVKHAIKLLAGYWFLERENGAEKNINNIPMGVESLLIQDRLFP